MSIEISNPQLLAKIERLSARLGVEVAIALETAVDRLLGETAETCKERKDDPWAGVDEIIAKLHALPPRPDAYDPLEWDEWGLPR